MNISDLFKEIVHESRIILSEYAILQFSPKLDYVDIFPKSESDCTTLTEQLQKMGTPVFQTSTGSAYQLFEPLATEEGLLRLARVRSFDPTRTEFLGHPDYAVADFDAAKEFLLKKTNVNLIERPDYEMIEIWDKKYNVLLYIPSIPLSQDIS